MRRHRPVAPPKHSLLWPSPLRWPLVPSKNLFSNLVAETYRMAIFQFMVSLVPLRWAESAHFNADDLWDGEFYDTEPAFIGYKPPKPVAETLDAVLPRSTSWHKNLSTWGSDKLSDIQVWSDNGAVRSIAVRLDMRSPAAELANRVEIAAASLECCFLYQEFSELLPLTPGCLIRKASSSRAALFALDPIAALRAR